MLRITAIEEVSQIVRLKVEGRVVGEWVPELDRTCTMLLAQKKNIVLDFSGVRFLDRRGIDAVKEMLGKRVKIIGARLWVQALLES
ncbi:MAG: STAS domain-containing protein [Nitrospirota bacterium]